MTVLLLEPHHDDAVLFACYTLLRERPTVVTVLGADTVQTSVSSEQRQQETRNAMEVLDLEQICWDESERDPDWASIEKRIADLNFGTSSVWVPLPEPEGHRQHNAVSETARTVFGGRCRYYATYRRGNSRTHTGHEVTPEPDWPAFKFQAMACYRSQINLNSCRPWFAANDMLREWIAP